MHAHTLLPQRPERVICVDQMRPSPATAAPCPPNQQAAAALHPHNAAGNSRSVHRCCSSRQRVVARAGGRHDAVDSTPGATARPPTPARGGGGHWRWPFGRQRADEEETEIIYVTDTAEADEIEQLPAEEDDEALQPEAVAAQQSVRGTPADTAAPSPPAAAAATVARQKHAVPEALATASAVSPQQQQQQQHSAAGASLSITADPRPAASLAAAARSSSGSSTSGYWEASAGGWVVAMSLLMAIRQGRAHADAARLDVRALQAKQQDSRVQGRELREKRAQYLKQQQLLKEVAAAKRLAERAREAEQERREAAAKAAEYEKAALEELERLRARRAAAKKEFEESQGKLDEELAARTAKEIALREEAEAKRAAEEAAARAAAAAEAARAAAAAAAAAEAAERAARETAAVRAAVKQQIRDASLCYQLSLQGIATAAPVVAAGGGSRQISVQLTLAPLAAPSAAVAADSSSSAPPPPPAPPVGSVIRVYASPDAALEGSAALAEQAAEQAARHYLPAAAEGATDLPGLSVRQPAVELEQDAAAAVGGAGAASLALLSEADLMLWRLLLLAKLQAAGRQAIGQVALLAASGELQQGFQADAVFSALPRAAPNSLDAQLAQVADLVVQQQQLQTAAQLMDGLIERHLDDFAGAQPDSSANSSSSSSLAQLLQAACSSSAGGGASASPFLVPACVYAVLLNMHDEPTQASNRRRAPAADASSSSSSSPDGSRPSTPAVAATADEDLFDALDGDDGGADGPASSAAAAAAAAAGRGRSIVSDRDSPLQRLAKFQLEQLAKAAPPDELAPVAATLAQLLGRRHAVAAAMQLLAERNMSPGARQARELKRQQKQLAMATELLRDSAVAAPGGAGGLDPQGARMRQALVPVPERIWALRNVANNLVRSAAASGGGGEGAAASQSAAAAEGLSMLQQAADLAAEHYGKTHPGQLSALLDYISALLLLPGHEAQARVAIEAACDVVQAVGERYRQQRDLLSLVLLFESTQAELDVPQVVGRGSAGMSRLVRQASDAFGVLDTAQASLVMSKRKLQPGSPGTALRQLARDCTEQLGVYAASRKRETRLEAWNKGTPLAPLR